MDEASANEATLHELETDDGMGGSSAVVVERWVLPAAGLDQDPTEEELKKHNAMQEEVIRDMLDDITQLKTANDDLRRQVASLKAEKTTGDQRIADLEANIEMLKDEKGDLAQKINNLVRSLETANDDLRRQVASLQAEKSNLERLVAEKTTVIAYLQTTHDKMVKTMETPRLKRLQELYAKGDELFEGSKGSKT